MRLKAISISNFRSYKSCDIALDRYTTFVGPNGAGKSNVLCALNLFFRESEGSNLNLSELGEEDFYNRDTQNPIDVTVTFCDLSDDAQIEFSEYFRQGELVVTARAIYDPVAKQATVKQFGQRRAMEDFAPFFELYNNGRPVAEMRAEFNRIRDAFVDITPATTKEGMREALRRYEEDNPGTCVLIPSEDQFYRFSRGNNRLAKFVQWIYVPAVKDASKENVEARNTALGKILARTVRTKVNFDEEIGKLRAAAFDGYKQLLHDQQGALDEISQSLTERLKQWAHPGAKARLSWKESVSLRYRAKSPLHRRPKRLASTKRCSQT